MKAATQLFLRNEFRPGGSRTSKNLLQDTGGADQSARSSTLATDCRKAWRMGYDTGEVSSPGVRSL
jgi:hypothetical protein